MLIYIYVAIFLLTTPLPVFTYEGLNVPAGFQAVTVRRKNSRPRSLLNSEKNYSHGLTVGDRHSAPPSKLNSAHDDGSKNQQGPTSVPLPAVPLQSQTVGSSKASSLSEPVRSPLQKFKPPFSTNTSISPSAHSVLAMPTDGQVAEAVTQRRLIPFPSRPSGEDGREGSDTVPLQSEDKDASKDRLEVPPNESPGAPDASEKENGDTRGSPPGAHPQSQVTVSAVTGPTYGNMRPQPFPYYYQYPLQYGHPAQMQRLQIEYDMDGHQGVTVRGPFINLSDPQNLGNRWCWKMITEVSSIRNWGYLVDYAECRNATRQSNLQEATTNVVCTDTGAIEIIYTPFRTAYPYSIGCMSREDAMASELDSCWVIHQKQPRYLVLNRVAHGVAGPCRPSELTKPFGDGVHIASRFTSAENGIPTLYHCNGGGYSQAIVPYVFIDDVFMGYDEAVCHPISKPHTISCKGIAVDCIHGMDPRLRSI